MSKDTAADEHRLPIVCQVGFAGSRSLFDLTAHPHLDVEALEAQVLAQFTERLRALPGALGIAGSEVFLCGVSQVAVGADTVFSDACAALRIPQRALLPRPVDDYLGDGRHGADFTASQQAIARGILARPNVVERRVVSRAEDRHDRFRDTNLAILDACDVALCLTRSSGGKAGAGGTDGFIARAKQLHVPLLALTVSLVDGQAVVSAMQPIGDWQEGERYRRPAMPDGLASVPSAYPVHEDVTALTATEYVATIKYLASPKAWTERFWYGLTTASTLYTHVAATLLATVSTAVLIVWDSVAWVCTLLALEILALAVGTWAHHHLHASERASKWATVRTAAELMRSLGAAEAAGANLDYVIAPAWDKRFASVLRTCLFLHLRGRAEGKIPAPADWKNRRDAYLTERLAKQFAYYGTEQRRAHWRMKSRNWAFFGLSLLALPVTIGKLALDLPSGPAIDRAFRFSEHAHLGAVVWLTVAAVGLPVLAESFVSWLTAHDVHARERIYGQMQEFLQCQIARCEGAESEYEFLAVLRDVELRLLNENLHWYERRASS